MCEDRGASLKTKGRENRLQVVVSVARGNWDWIPGGCYSFGGFSRLLLVADRLVDWLVGRVQVAIETPGQELD